MHLRLADQEADVRYQPDHRSASGCACAAGVLLRRTVSAMAVTLAVFTGIQILVSGLLIPGGCRGRLRDPTAGPRDVDVPVGGGPWDVVI